MLKHIQIISKILPLLSIVFCISAYIYSIQAYSFHIGLFDNVDIQISGNNYIDSYYIENEIYLQMSSSILSVNLTDIQNKLEFMDYIEAVQVSRILPHTLMIHIVERSPVLLMNKADIITFMDKNGVLLPADKKSLRTFPVPVLSILDEKGPMDKYTVDIAESFQFLIDKYPLFYKNLSEVKIKEDVWEFYSDYNTKIYAHASCITDQLNILKDFEKTLHPIRNLEDYHYIDLRIKNQVIVKEKYRQG